MWLKSRLLIGREPKILPSDWSRGPPENVQRGYPYDLESLPLECFWHHIGTALVHIRLFYSANCLYRGKCPSKGPMNLSCTMKTGWQIILIVIPVVEVTQEWFKWHGIGELTIH